MKQEDKELLLRDLCARLPYGVKCEVYDRVGVLDEISSYGAAVNYDNGEDTTCRIEYIKPYLFPLSSMTEEQYNEFFSYYHNIEMAEVKASGDYLKAAYIGDDAKYSWLNKNHFDYRGLIPKDLALNAIGLNIY